MGKSSTKNKPKQSRNQLRRIRYAAKQRSEQPRQTTQSSDSLRETLEEVRSVQEKHSSKKPAKKSTSSHSGSATPSARSLLKDIETIVPEPEPVQPPKPASAPTPLALVKSVEKTNEDTLEKCAMSFCHKRGKICDIKDLSACIKKQEDEELGELYEHFLSI